MNARTPAILNPLGASILCIVAACADGPSIELVFSGGNIAGLAADPTSLYWLDSESNAVLKAPLIGGILLGTPETLAHSGCNLSGISVSGSAVYWLSDGSGPGGNEGAVMRVAVAGGIPTTVAAFSDQPWALAINSNNVFWTTSGTAGGDGAVHKTGLNGGQPIVLVSAAGAPVAIAADEFNVYWANGYSTSGAIMKVTVSGGPSVTLASNQNNPIGITVAGNRVFWVNAGTPGYSDGAVLSVPSGGGVTTTLAAGQPSPAHIATDGTNVYWTNHPGGTSCGIDCNVDYGNGSVERVSVSGRTVSDIAIDRTAPSFIAVAGGSVYWSETPPAFATPSGPPSDVSTRIMSAPK